MYEYSYVNGVRLVTQIASVYSLEQVGFKLTRDIKNKTTELSVFDEKSNLIHRSVLQWKQTWFVYRMFPYFGGVEKAPKNIKLKLWRQ